jgi:cyclopropane-fatty-acyl-phospholipid synthase
LQVRLPGDVIATFGDDSGPRLRVAITSTGWCTRILVNSVLALGEAYMEGGLIIEEGELHQFADLLGRNAKHRPSRRANGLLRWWRDHRLQANARQASRRKVAHHYDLSVDLSRRFLDEDIQYSCAYFAADGMSLELAQAAKKRHLAASAC